MIVKLSPPLLNAHICSSMDFENALQWLKVRIWKLSKACYRCNFVIPTPLKCCMEGVWGIKLEPLVQKFEDGMLCLKLDILEILGSDSWVGCKTACKGDLDSFKMWFWMCLGFCLTGFDESMKKMNFEGLWFYGKCEECDFGMGCFSAIKDASHQS